MVTRSEIETFLDEVCDPEIPVLTIRELGILRSIEVVGESVTITLTPTYSGCPAMQAIADEVRACLSRHGIEKLNIQTSFNPPWTTEWLSDIAKQKLRDFGIAPPVSTPQSDLVLFPTKRRNIPCPRCKSIETEQTSEFSSTACKALYRCLTCREAFEYFKEH